MGGGGGGWPNNQGYRRKLKDTLSFFLLMVFHGLDLQLLGAVQLDFLVLRCSRLVGGSFRGFSGLGCLLLLSFSAVRP